MNKVLILLFGLVIFSCSNEKKGDVENLGPNPDLVAEHTLEHVVRNEGRKAVVGNLVTYLQRTYLNDSLIGDPKSFGYARTDVLPEDSLISKPYNPTYAAMFKMAVGDSVYIKQPIGSVENLPKSLKKSDVFSYELKLLNIETEQEAMQQYNDMQIRDSVITSQMRKFVSDYSSGILDSEFEKTETGIEFIVHELGKGIIPKEGIPVFVNFSSFLLDGKETFSTFVTGTPLNFPLGRKKMIPGLEEIIAKFPKGTKITLVVPPELGYGAMGKSPQIPDDSELAIYLEIVNL